MHKKIKKLQIKVQQRTEFYKILAAVTDACGVSSREEEVVKEISAFAKPYAQKITRCGQGSLIVHAKNNQNTLDRETLMLDAHMDEVGLLITKIHDKGYLHVMAVGGLWNHVILAQKYFIVTRTGKRIAAVTGSIPIHIVTRQQRDKVVENKSLYLDIGASNLSEVLLSGVRIGDFAYKATKTFSMVHQGYVCGKALDNRFSCAALLVLLKELACHKLPLDVVLVFSCQEEVGLRGVKTATHKVNPDIAIVVDTTVSNDQYESKVGEDCQLGGGPVMGIADAYVNSNSRFLDYLRNICLLNAIPYGFNASLGGGTNGGYVYRAHKGITTAVISLPTRYLHTHTEVCNLDDGILTVALLKHFILSYDQKSFANQVAKNFHNADPD